MEEKQEILTQDMELTVGQILHNARTTGRRKREISTISKSLCIREDFLTALEEGNYRFIPEDVYILGFARSYAVELGLNPDEIILKLKHELGLIKDEDKEEEKVEKIEKVEKKEEKKEVEDKVESQKKILKINKEKILKQVKSEFEYVKKHWIWFASGLVVVILAVVLSLVLLNGKKGIATETMTGEEIVAVENTTQEVEKKEPEFRYPVREKFDTKTKKEWANARVVLQAEKESWVQIKDARGNTVFTRVLVPGDVYYMPLKDNLKATFGNAGAIDVWVDGQLLKKVGPANTRKEGISMSPDALKAIGFAE